MAYAFVSPLISSEQTQEAVIQQSGLGDLLDPSTWGLSEFLLFAAAGYLIYTMFFSPAERERRTGRKKALTSLDVEYKKKRAGVKSKYSRKARVKREEGEESPSGKKWSKGRWVSPDTYDEEQLA